MFRPGTIFPERIAAASAKGDSMPPLHSSKYDPEPGPSIATGIRAMTAAVAKLLPPQPWKRITHFGWVNVSGSTLSRTLNSTSSDEIIFSPSCVAVILVARLMPSKSL